jgi:hypothetical protein
MICQESKREKSSSDLSKNTFIVGSNITPNKGQILSNYLSRVEKRKEKENTEFSQKLRPE